MERFQMSNFWDKVAKCKHENTWDCYDAYVGCDTPYCSASEYHCKDCKAYITECDCGSSSGISGWPHKRVMKWQKKKYEI
jgi:hypothetical protein